jgi:hypothetical protein
LLNSGRSCFFFLFSAVLGRTAAVGSILICLPWDYAQSVQNFDAQFSLSSKFLPSPPIKFVAQVGIFWDISRQDSSRISISPPITLNFCMVDFYVQSNTGIVNIAPGFNLVIRRCWVDLISISLLFQYGSLIS